VREPGHAALPALAVAPVPQPLLGLDLRDWAEPFDRAFTVSRPDPRFAAAVLTPTVTQFLLDVGRGVG
jgi:hypothetical protein